MIDVEEAIFPNNVVTVVAACYEGLDSDVAVIKRPLRAQDPQQSIGVFAQMWDPQNDSLEIMGQANAHPQRPTLQRYVLGVQAFIRDGDEERGLAVHATLAHRVRAVLYSHPTLKLVLASLKVEFEDGSTEQLQRWGITGARYFSNEVEGTNLYLSTLEFWVETETHSGGSR